MQLLTLVHLFPSSCPSTTAFFMSRSTKVRHRYHVTWFVVLDILYYGILSGEKVQFVTLDGVEVAVARLAKGSRVVAIALCPN